MLRTKRSVRRSIERVRENRKMVPRDSVAIVGIQPEERNSRSKYGSKFHLSSKRKECKHRRDKNNESVFDDLGFVSFLFTRGILSPLQFGEGTLAVIINVLITAARGHGSRGGWTAAERPLKGSTLTRAEILEPIISPFPFLSRRIKASLLWGSVAQRRIGRKRAVAIDKTYATFQFLEGGGRGSG